MMPLFPKNQLGSIVGPLVHKKWPKALNEKLKQSFVDYYQINMSEAEKSLEEYDSIGDLFTRRLKPDARPIQAEMVHPCDALILKSGQIQEQTLIQAKSKNYSCAELIRNSKLALEFEGGQFATYYLCPTDYHRIHYPMNGKIFWSCHVPGQFWPVNHWSTENIDDLYVQNERVITSIQTPRGKIIIVMVAATNVGDMEIFYDSQLNLKSKLMTEKTYDETLDVKVGEELGVFKMGSTVVVLFEKNVLDFELENLQGVRVQMGTSLKPKN